MKLPSNTQKTRVCGGGEKLGQFAIEIKNVNPKFFVLFGRMRTPKPPPDKPVGYPRCDWYYLEDNAIEDSSQQPNSQSGQVNFFIHSRFVLDMSVLSVKDKQI